MYEIVQLIWMIILAGVAVWDILYRKIPVWVLMILLGLAIGCKVVLDSGDFVNVAAGAAVGTGFLLVSRWTRQAFGYADSLLILILGVFLGVWELLLLLLLAFGLAAVYSMIGLMMKKFSRKAVIPFVPFLAVSYAGVMMIGM